MLYFPKKEGDSVDVYKRQFYTKYIRDLLEEQKRLDGKVPDVAPLLISRKPGEANPMLANGGGNCGWADAARCV